MTDKGANEETQQQILSEESFNKHLFNNDLTSKWCSITKPKGMTAQISFALSASTASLNLA